VIVTVLTQFLISKHSNSLFGDVNLNLDKGLNNITGTVHGKLLVYRYDSTASVQLKITPNPKAISGEMIFMKKGMLSITDNDHGLQISNETVVFLCPRSTMYIGVEGNSTYFFTIVLTYVQTEDQCNYLISPSFALAAGIGGIFLFVGILFFLLACLYKRRFRASQGYINMTENPSDAASPFSL